jgi:hypothetical protein
MKALWIEIRLYIAELLLGLAMRVAPKGVESDQITQTVYKYFKNKIDESTTKL